MAKYRKVDPRIWNDRKFNALSVNGKLAFLFLLTHPHMTALGAMRATIPGLVAELDGVGEKAFREAFDKGMAKCDEKACFLWLPRFLKYNPPESPNVVVAWSKALDLLPECPLKSELIQQVKGYAEGLSEGFRKALPKDFAKSMPIQEQEQEQEQDKHTSTTVGGLNGYQKLFDEKFWPAYPKKVGKQEAFKAFRKIKAPASKIDQIVAAIETQKQSEQWTKERGAYIPNPKTWIDQGRWEDELTTAGGNPYAWRRH